MFQDSAVWLGLTSREQLMSPECSKHQVLRCYIYIYINKFNWEQCLFL